MVSRMFLRSRRVMSAPAVLLAALVAVLVWRGASAFASTPASRTNGTYEVQVLKGGEWVTVATPAFGLTYSTAAVDLGGSHSRVRLVQHGGTAAQLDRVSLDGAAATAVSGSTDPLALKKLAASDHDVTNVFASAVELSFPAAGSRLTLDARVQGDISRTFPFEYPQANTFGPVTAASSFYTVDISALPTEIDQTAPPFLTVLAEPGTGHPKGYTYMWLARSGSDLLATIDFTSDNTMDGDEDYATVHALTASGVRDFKQSVADRTWGTVAFAYTDKVSYQHKVYDFRIPLAQAGATAGTAKLAFTTYGTAAVSFMPVYRFYNKVNGTHFYTADPAERDVVSTTLGATYVLEGVAYQVNVANPDNDTPLYRFYNKVNGTHFYTADAAEKDAIVAGLGNVYRLEGVAYNVCATDVLGATTVFRFYDTRTASHFYTASAAEKDAVVANLNSIYRLEGPGFYVAP